MNQAEKFVDGRGAIPIREVGEFLSRGHSYVYVLIGKGELRQITPGHVTADSLIEFYARFEGGAAYGVNPSRTVPARRGEKGLTNRAGGGGAPGSSSSEVPS